MDLGIHPVLDLSLLTYANTCYICDDQCGHPTFYIKFNPHFYSQPSTFHPGFPQVVLFYLLLEVVCNSLEKRPSVYSTFVLPQLRHVFASIEARIIGPKTLLLTDHFVYNLY